MRHDCFAPNHHKLSMGDRYGSQPLRPRERERDRDRDRDDFGVFSRGAPPPPEPTPRSQVRLKIPDSVIDDDGFDAREDSDRHSHHKARNVRDENGAPDRPALRRRKSVDLERKTSRQNEEFRRRRDELEAQEAVAMRRSEVLPRRLSMKSEMRDGADRRYDERGKGMDRRDDRDRDVILRGGGDWPDDGRRRGNRDRLDEGSRRDDRDRRDGGGRKEDRYRRDDGTRRGEPQGRDDEALSDHGGRRHHHHGDKRDYERRREEDEAGSDYVGRRHHSDRRDHPHRREDRDRRDDGLSRYDDRRREEGPRRGDERRKGDDSRRRDDRESEPRRQKKRDVPDGPDPLSDAVSYGSDPVEQVVSRDDGERRKQSFPRSDGIIDLDELLEKPPGGGSRRPERDIRDRELRTNSPPAFDQTRPKNPARNLEDRPRNDKSGYYDSYGPGKDRLGRPADWDDRRDRERR